MKKYEQGREMKMTTHAEQSVGVDEADKETGATADTRAISRLRAFIEGELLMGRARIDDDEELLLSGLIDSLGAVRLIGFIETELSVHVPPEDVIIENFQSLSAMREYIRQHATH
jgi:acyl carrier protein